MRLKEWFALRGSEYVRERGLSLLDRYDLEPTKATDRIKRCLTMLAEHGCVPTFPTPGRIVLRYPKFMHQIQKMGAEIAVHGYDHLDLRTYSTAKAGEQLEKAVRVFNDAGIEVHGFRCPYLSCSEELLHVLPEGMFEYSSNKAVRWDVISSESMESASTVFDRVAAFYQADSSNTTVSTPRMIGKLVEIPASTPDDLQLLDGLNLGDEGVGRAWSDILERTHSRGECFVVVFHPESFDECSRALGSVLTEARHLKPAVWISHLAEVSQWWREKSRFTSHTTNDEYGAHIHFDCTERSTVLIRNVETSDPSHPWFDTYRVLEGRALNLANGRLPFIGLAPNVPPTTFSFLQEQGYMIDTCMTTRNCSLFLDASTISNLSEVELVDYIETSTAPLVRYWRWPREAKSVLCITGDLDALSLIDYASRLFRP